MSNDFRSEQWLAEVISRPGGARLAKNHLSSEAAKPSQLNRRGEREAAQKVEPVVPKKSKYRNVKTVVDGITFDSKREAKRYCELLVMVKAGEIRDLELQVEFELLRTPIRMSYVADFTYYEKRRRLPFNKGHFWIYVVEDSKGTRTREYVRKRKAMKTVHGIVIRET